MVEVAGGVVASLSYWGEIPAGDVTPWCIGRWCKFDAREGVEVKYAPSTVHNGGCEDFVFQITGDDW
jgi:hypothetical protein